MAVYRLTVYMKWLKGFLPHLPVVNEMPSALESLYLSSTQTTPSTHILIQSIVELPRWLTLAKTLEFGSWSQCIILHNLVIGPTRAGEKVNVIAPLWLPYVPYKNSRRFDFHSFFPNVSLPRVILPSPAMIAQKRFTSTLQERSCFYSLWKPFFWPLILPLGLLPMEDDVINPSMI